GRLRSPMAYSLGLYRQLGIQLTEPLDFAYIYSGMGEAVLDSPSVFGHYSPLFHIPQTSLFGPEFQIFGPTEAVNRANSIYDTISAYGSPIIDQWTNIAGDPVQLVNAVNDQFLFGRMSQAFRNTLYTALQSSTDNKTRALTVLYLTFMSGD